MRYVHHTIFYLRRCHKQPGRRCTIENKVFALTFLPYLRIFRHTCVFLSNNISSTTTLPHLLHYYLLHLHHYLLHLLAHSHAHGRPISNKFNCSPLQCTSTSPPYEKAAHNSAVKKQHTLEHDRRMKFDCSCVIAGISYQLFQLSSGHYFRFFFFFKVDGKRSLEPGPPVYHMVHQMSNFTILCDTSQGDYGVCTVRYHETLSHPS